MNSSERGTAQLSRRRFFQLAGAFAAGAAIPTIPLIYVAYRTFGEHSAIIDNPKPNSMQPSAIFVDFSENMLKEGYQWRVGVVDAGRRTINPSEIAKPNGDRSFTGSQRWTVQVRAGIPDKSGTAHQLWLLHTGPKGAEEFDRYIEAQAVENKWPGLTQLPEDVKEVVGVTIYRR